MEFDRGLDRTGTNCAKWDFLEEYFGREDLLPMWVADSDWKTSEAIIDALKDRVEHGAFGYSKPGEEQDKAVVDWVKRRYHWEIDPEWIVYTNGITPSLSLSVRTFTDLGDSVVIQPPVYFPFYSLVENSGGRVLENQLKYDGTRYKMDIEDLKEKFDPSDPDAVDRTSMMILCNPHNPVGRSWTEDELEEVAEMALENDVLVVSDEIFSDYIYHGKHTPFSSLSDEVARNSITLITPTKSFNIAGLKIGIAIIPDPGLRKRFENSKELLVKEPNVLGLVALEAAYENGEEWLEAQLEYLEDNKDYALKFIQKIPGVKAVEPDSTFLLWLDFRELGLGTEELKDSIINEANVALIEGSKYGAGGEGFMRLNFACPRDTLKEGLERIKSALERVSTSPT